MLRKKLGAWYLAQARDLPWRRTTDPYAIMVSEFMLQQTTVTAVIPYYQRWMERFPTPASLAAAAEEEVLHLWQGLGYYSRARNLHRAAQYVCEHHGGKLPEDPALIRALPGVGDYTAAAIQAFAWDRPTAVIDANIARVLARLNNWQAPIDDTAGKLALQEFSLALQPKGKGGRVHNSSLMELGALICVSGNPRCLACPVSDLCRATAPAELPRKRPKALTLEVRERRAVFHAGDRIWLHQSQGPRWKGLWILPETEASGRAVHIENYTITRYRVEMHLIPTAQPPPETQPFTINALPPMPSPHRRAVAALVANGHIKQQ